MNDDSDYLKYRGKCKEMCEEILLKNPSLRIVRGHYYCPIWNTEEPHWWLEDKDGNITDPTKLQFGSKGLGTYTEFDGNVSCSECNKKMKEEEATFESNYVFCSTKCHMIFVGLGEFV